MSNADAVDPGAVPKEEEEAVSLFLTPTMMNVERVGGVRPTQDGSVTRGWGRGRRPRREDGNQEDKSESQSSSNSEVKNEVAEIADGVAHLSIKKDNSQAVHDVNEVPSFPNTAEVTSPKIIPADMDSLAVPEVLAITETEASYAEPLTASETKDAAGEAEFKRTKNTGRLLTTNATPKENKHEDTDAPRTIKLARRKNHKADTNKLNPFEGQKSNGSTPHDHSTALTPSRAKVLRHPVVKTTSGLIRSTPVTCTNEQFELIGISMESPVRPRSSSSSSQLSSGLPNAESPVQDAPAITTEIESEAVGVVDDKQVESHDARQSDSNDEELISELMTPPPEEEKLIPESQDLPVATEAFHRSTPVEELKRMGNQRSFSPVSSIEGGLSNEQGSPANFSPWSSPNRSMGMRGSRRRLRDSPLLDEVQPYGYAQFSAQKRPDASCLIIFSDSDDGRKGVTSKKDVINGSKNEQPLITLSVEELKELECILGLTPPTSSETDATRLTPKTDGRRKMYRFRKEDVRVYMTHQKSINKKPKDWLMIFQYMRKDMTVTQEDILREIGRVQAVLKIRK